MDSKKIWGALALSAIIATSSPAVSHAKIESGGKDSVVTLTSQSTSNSYKICTGTVIDPHWILTAAHCAHDGNDIFASKKVSDQNALVYHVTAKYPSSTSDIALMRVDEEMKITPSTVRTSVADAGDSLTNYGRNKWEIKSAVSTVSNYSTGSFYPYNKFSSATLNSFVSGKESIRQGDSGGPTFDSENNVVGVISYSNTSPGGKTAFVSQSAISQNVKDWIDYMTSHTQSIKRAGAPVANVPLAVLNGGELPVKATLEGKPGAGEYALYVNGKKVDSSKSGELNWHVDSSIAEDKKSNVGKKVSVVVTYTADGVTTKSEANNVRILDSKASNVFDGSIAVLGLQDTDGNGNGLAMKDMLYGLSFVNLTDNAQNFSMKLGGAVKEVVLEPREATGIVPSFTAANEDGLLTFQKDGSAYSYRLPVYNYSIEGADMTKKSVLENAYPATPYENIETTTTGSEGNIELSSITPMPDLMKRDLESSLGVKVVQTVNNEGEGSPTVTSAPVTTEVTTPKEDPDVVEVQPSENTSATETSKATNIPNPGEPIATTTSEPSEDVKESETKEPEAENTSEVPGEGASTTTTVVNEPKPGDKDNKTPTFSNDSTKVPDVVPVDVSNDGERPASNSTSVSTSSEHKPLVTPEEGTKQGQLARTGINVYSIITLMVLTSLAFVLTARKRKTS